jgi:ATP-binding cassette subfamily A (ABC1) protein 3
LNILTGITRATGGAAEIYETNILDGEMRIAEHVGVCCQFDCIWENLTPVEHLRLFGRMKGLNGGLVDLEAKLFLSGPRGSS